MGADPLGAFRGGRAAPQLAPMRPVGYRAFEAGRERPPRLDIRTKDQPCYAPAYSSLVNITYDASDYAGIILTFGANFVVKLEGANLQPLVECLKTNHCSFIEEYDAKRYGSPEDGAPIIKRIIVQNGQRSAAQTVPKAEVPR